MKMLKGYFPTDSEKKARDFSDDEIADGVENEKKWPKGLIVNVSSKVANTLKSRNLADMHLIIEDDEEEGGE